MEPERPPIFAIALGATTAATRLFRFGRALRVTVIVKASFALVPEGIATPVGPEPVYSRELAGHATAPASILRPSDLAPHMPCAAVMVVGHARAPRGHVVASLPVRLFVVGDVVLVDKSVLVFGDRHHPAAPPTPFEKMPLAWERTYGGPFFPPNPVGMGADTGDHRLQNLVDPTGAVVPACFAPISKHWSPRRSLLASAPPAFAGPVLDVPDAFDWTYFVPCAPDQRAPFLVGGEWLVLDGIHPDHPRLRTRLPVLRGLARLHTASPAREALPPFALTLDTVLIDTDAERVSLTFRGSAEVPEACPFDAITAVAGVEVAGETLRFPSIDEVALRRRAEEGPTRVDLRTEPPPAALLPSFNEGTERLDPALVAALSRPLAPYPVAAPYDLVAGSEPIPGSPWGPPLEAAGGAQTLADPVTADLMTLRHRAEDEGADEPQPGEPSTSEVVRDSSPSLPFLDAKRMDAPLVAAPIVAAPIIEAAIVEAPTNEATAEEAPLVPPLSERPPVAAPEVLAAPLRAAPSEPAQLDAQGPRARVIAAISARALLDGWDLSGADLSGLDLSALSLARANLRRANLSEARLSGSDLTQADLTGATLSGASLRGATLAEARLDDVHAEDADFTSVTAQKLRCVGGHLARSNFARADLSGAILEKSNLDDATFFEATLRGAGLVGASCRRVDFGAADLTDARLRETAVSGARFSEAKLRGAKLQRAEGEGAVFTSADLEGADLRNALLTEPDFRGAVLRRAWMDNAQLIRARMARADLSRASLRNTKLVAADLEGAKLDGADFRDADLSAAKLSGATRVGAKMTGAKLDEVPDDKPKAGS